MTDNRTTELHAICDEIQAEHEQAIAATLGNRPAKSGRGYYTDRDDEGTHIMCYDCGGYIGTAEEIAATLGRPKAKSHPYGCWSDDDEQEKRLSTEVEELLDSQAAITERERERHWLEIVGASANCNLELANRNAELQAKVDELEASLFHVREKNASQGARIMALQEGGGAAAILREAATNVTDYHDPGEALRRLTDTTNVYYALEALADMIEQEKAELGAQVAE